MTQTTETMTKTISTDRYCYTTEKKLLGPKTKECSEKRSIDTSIIMGLGKKQRVKKTLRHFIERGINFRARRL